MEWLLAGNEVVDSPNPGHHPGVHAKEGVKRDPDVEGINETSNIMAFVKESESLTKLFKSVSGTTPVLILLEYVNMP